MHKKYFNNHKHLQAFNHARTTKWLWRCSISFVKAWLENKRQPNSAMKNLSHSKIHKIAKNSIQSLQIIAWRWKKLYIISFKREKDEQIKKQIQHSLLRISHGWNFQLPIFLFLLDVETKQNKTLHKKYKAVKELQRLVTRQCKTKKFPH